MTNLTNAIEMVVNAGLRSAGEIEAFVMDKANNVTVPMLDAGLRELMVAFNKRMVKAVKANLFARELEMELALEARIPMPTCQLCGHEAVLEETEFGFVCNSCFTAKSEEAAAGETPVAETKSKEEFVVSKVPNGFTESEWKEALRKNQVVLNKMSSDVDVTKMVSVKVVHENPAVAEMMDKVNSAKDKYLEHVAPHVVTVMHVEFYPEKDDATRQQVRERKFVRTDAYDRTFIGEVIVRVPRGYMQVKTFDRNKINSKGKKGAPVWVDMADYNINTVQRKYTIFNRLTEGSGLLVLPIKEDKEGRPTINLPVDFNQGTGEYSPLFQTSDARFTKTKNTTEVDEPLFLSDNNYNFNAQVSAFVQVYSNEFVQANPMNNHAYNKANCANMVRFSTKDGIMDDLNAESKKSRVILEQPDVAQLSTVGAEQPRTYCMVRDIWLDEEAVHALNEADKMEKTEALDEEGNVRFPRHDEVVIAGKIVKRNTVRQAAVEKICGACPFYCGNSPKSESQVAKERTEAREAGVNAYVSPFYRERAKAKAQHIQTLVQDGSNYTWVPKFPGELEAPLAFRVKGAGMIVEGTDDVMGYVDPEFVAPVETFDARHADIMKKINQIFYAAFNLDKLSESQAEVIFDMADNKPEGLTEDEAKRWDNAVHWLAQGLTWAAEREELRKQQLFTQKFFPGLVEGAEELHVNDIMGDTLYRAEHDMLGWGLGYEDLLPTEFTRYLDEVAIDYVYDVILNGTVYSIVGGTDKDKELAAGALQEMLQREINYVFTRGVRRDANPGHALDALKVSDEVKAYITTVVKLG